MGYQEILYILKQNIKAAVLNSDLSINRELNKNLDRSSITIRDPQYPITRTHSLYKNYNLPKKNADVSDYSEFYSRFYEESDIMSNSAIHRNIFHPEKSSFNVKAKIDELNALAASKEREEQGRAVQYQRRLERLIAEKEAASVLIQQIKEKSEKKLISELEDKNYALQLDERVKYMEKLNADKKQRSLKMKQVYSKALDTQLLQKKTEQEYIQQIENNAKKILRATPTDERVSAYDYSSRSDKRLSMHSGSKSPFRFLAQYGNIVITRDKK
jgi:hypothetical protein